MRGFVLRALEEPGPEAGVCPPIRSLHTSHLPEHHRGGGAGEQRGRLAPGVVRQSLGSGAKGNRVCLQPIWTLEIAWNYAATGSLKMSARATRFRPPCFAT
jgi:hypothetical protein